MLGKFTKGKGPWRIIYREEGPTIEAALKREKYLKSGVGREFIKDKNYDHYPWYKAK
jgi:putative endonuclease